MGFADSYFKRQNGFEVKIHSKPPENLKYTVIIPCYNEFNVIDTLNSLWYCKRAKRLVEVLVIINSSENDEKKIKEQNIITFQQINNWVKEHTDPLLQFYTLLENNLPEKFAGAGMARKIGMDQAIYRFSKINQDKGVIISLDADAIVKSNYFKEIESSFNSKTNLALIHFEHPTMGNEFDKKIYNAITIYELYLRYYKLALKQVGFPYAYYTVGSSFAVRADVYARQGGMNRKKAGEDFYFLHKIFPLGYVKEINTTCVYPSPRPSDRVPFGTGPMVRSIIESDGQDLYTYNFDAFIELESLFNAINTFYKIKRSKLTLLLEQMPVCISDFLTHNGFLEAIEEVNQNSSSINTFRKRFFNWFNAFRLLKFMNFAHEKYYRKEKLIDETVKLLKKLDIVYPDDSRNYKVFLNTLREYEMY